MNLVNSKTLVDLTGLSAPAISKAVRGKLAPACIGEGKKLQIDLEHPVVVDYIETGRKRKATAGKQKNAKAPAIPPPPGPGSNTVLSLENNTGEVLDLEQLTLKEIALKYGGAAQFKDYVKALKDIADYKNKEQAHLIKRGELIERDTTAAALFMLVDIAFKRLVGEMPNAITPQLVPLILSGGEGSEQEAKQLLIDQVSKILKDCKAEVRKRLRRTTDSKGGSNG